MPRMPLFGIDIELLRQSRRNSIHTRPVQFVHFFCRFLVPEICHLDGKSMCKKFIAEIMGFLFQLTEQMRLILSAINGFIAV